MLPAYKIIRSRRKTITFIIQPNGELEVRAPHKVSDQEIMRLVRKKAEWIKTKQFEAQKNFALYLPKSFVDGEKFWYLGKKYPLKIVPSLDPTLVLSRKFYLSQEVLPQAKNIFTEWYRENTRREATRRVEELTKRHGLTYRRIRITSARTRWGSCSSNGNFNFPWRLVMAPPKVIDYVVAHEVAHLEIKNHSKSFWSLVGRLMPDYQIYKSWLKDNGQQLNF